MIELILASCLARIFEAAMDAEQFNHPTEPRSLAWHLLKFPRVLMWILYGFQINHLNYGYAYNALVLALALFLAFIVFEISLRLFRRVL